MLQARLIINLTDVNQSFQPFRIAICADWQGWASELQQAQQSFGDSNVSFLEFPVQSLASASNLGCEYHPGVNTQQSMSVALVGHLQGVLGW